MTVSVFQDATLGFPLFSDSSRAGPLPRGLSTSVELGFIAAPLSYLSLFLLHLHGILISLLNLHSHLVT